jgi:cell division protein FtsL
MSEHHHHHHRDGASRFKERSLNAIVRRRKLEKYLKIALTVVAALMVLAVIYVYTMG